MLFQHFLDSIRATVVKRVGPRGSENGATLLGNSFYFVAGERHDVGLAQAFITADKSHELMSVHARSLENSCPDDRIQSGGVATAGEHSNLHGSILPG